MTNFRPYRNSDSPALAALWNRGTPEEAAARPLSVHEFDARVVGGVHFDAAGLIVAERDGKPVAFVHAGFGPQSLTDHPLALDPQMGTVAMLVLEPGSIDPDLEARLMREAEQYLRSRGASVIYAGGQFPVNPYYWGVYGGSEWAGILGTHAAFHRAVERAGYEPVSTTVLLEADLSLAETFDPRGVLIRRQTDIEVVEEAQPETWWHALAVGDYTLTTYRLLARGTRTELAHATTWDMEWFGRRDGLARIGMIDMEVHPDHRRKGYGRHIINEIIRVGRAKGAAALAVQTRATNSAGLSLYQSVGFFPVETATLYRAPGSLA